MNSPISWKFKRLFDEYCLENRLCSIFWDFNTLFVAAFLTQLLSPSREVTSQSFEITLVVIHYSVHIHLLFDHSVERYLTFNSFLFKFRKVPVHYGEVKMEIEQLMVQLYTSSWLFNVYCLEIGLFIYFKIPIPSWPSTLIHALHSSCHEVTCWTAEPGVKNYSV